MPPSATRSPARVPNSLKVLARGNGLESVLKHCDVLMGESGSSVGVALAAQTLCAYERLDQAQRKDFFLALLAKFSPDPRTVLAAAGRYAEDASPRHLWALEQATEPPRQELLRRLNRAPGGTAAILRMREHLIECLRDHAELEAVDLDFHHLLSSWFNPGFLQIVEVSWHTPAEVLERIIQHERVHEIQGWDDLRRRLQRDRRCFAFFHPALPEEPLVFVEVALVDEMPSSIAPLLDASLPARDPAQARVGVFYSISNCQPGLRGVSLGNFLIKQVVDRLSAEFPGLKRFCTLSPIPGFTAWLSPLLRNPSDAPATLTAAVDKVGHELNGDIATLAAEPAKALERLDAVKPPLMQLCAAYFLGRGRGGERTPDAVARFHLSNGARLERVNWAANPSRKGLRESLGLMVNYLYDPARIERNHELFSLGRNVASPPVRALLPRR
jgi:malonyl-CoA decarboxylase